MMGDVSVPQMLALAILAMVSVLVGRWAGAGWRKRRREREEQSRRAGESRQVRRARERRERE